MKKKETRSLMCALNEDEANEYSKQLARTTTEIGELEEEKKNVTQDYANKINSKRSMTKSLAHKVTTRQEMRPVDCYWDYMWATSERRLVRLDTHQEVEVDVIPEHERQQRLRDQEDGKEVF
jgi:hypothetical protein